MARERERHLAARGRSIEDGALAEAEDFPKIALEVVIDNAVANLSRRDADIAVRMFRPEQLALVARRVGAVRFGLFATRDYLRRMGVPRTVDDAREHTLIGSDRELGWARAISAAGLSAADFKFRSDSLVAQVAAILHGVGIGGMHVRVAARHPTLVRVLPKLPLEPVDAWVVMHEDLRNSPAVRTVFAALFSYLKRETEQSPGRKRERERA